VWRLSRRREDDRLLEGFSEYIFFDPLNPEYQWSFSLPEFDGRLFLADLVHALGRELEERCCVSGGGEWVR
jgi:hypothetical protein